MLNDPSTSLALYAAFMLHGKVVDASFLYEIKQKKVHLSFSRDKYHWRLDNEPKHWNPPWHRVSALMLRGVFACKWQCWNKSFITNCKLFCVEKMTTNWRDKTNTKISGQGSMLNSRKRQNNHNKVNLLDFSWVFNCISVHQQVELTKQVVFGIYLHI